MDPYIILPVYSIQHYDQVCQLLAAGWWFSPVSATNKTDRHDTIEILLKVALNTITLRLLYFLKLVLTEFTININ